MAAHWEPFFSSSPSYSEHSTADALSLQGSEPFNGHPKTLRDLSNAGQMLMLPAAFGAIQLGETFSCCLAVNNETGEGVDAVSLKVEMQTATNKTTLTETGGGDYSVLAKDTLQTVVSHEIRELGQHVLACNVSYRWPGRPLSPGTLINMDNDSSLQYFRKFYKFNVSPSSQLCVPLNSLVDAAGHKSAFCQNESSCAEKSNGSHVEKRKGKSVLGGSHPKSDTKCFMVRTNTSRARRRMASIG